LIYFHNNIYINKGVVRDTGISNYSNSLKGTISMTIYIYKKTHNKTGLNYLGKTSARNPHTYPGSGTYWRAHLDKHGYDYNTEILKECQTNEEVAEWGIYYSQLWNVVKSNDWANLTEERGAGGNNIVWTDEMRRASSERQKGKLSPNKGKTYDEIHGTEKAKEKIEKFKKSFEQTLLSKPKKEKPNKLPYCSDRIGVSYEELYGIEKANEIRAKQKGKLAGEKNPRYGKPGTMKGKKHTEEALAKMCRPPGPHKNKRELFVCPHC
jgi:hypothetical protein